MSVARALVGLSAMGVAVSGYLTWHRITNTQLWCAGFGSCDLVNASRYAKLAGIPVAYLGLGMYLTLLALSLWAAARAQEPPLAATLGIFVLSMSGFLFSLYLTGIELFVLHAVCAWCVASFLIITAIFALAAVNLAQQAKVTARGEG